MSTFQSEAVPEFLYITNLEKWFGGKKENEKRTEELTLRLYLHTD